MWAAALLAVRVTVGAESATALGKECVALLWFLGVYLVVLAFVPALMKLPTGRGVAVLIGTLLAAAYAVDQIRIAVGAAEAGVANFVTVWLIPVAIGVAYARRLITPRAALAVAASAFTAQVLLAAAGVYEVSLVVTGTETMSNVSPPTLLLALHCTWMSCVFVAAAGAIRRWAERPRVWQVVAVGNGGAMTLYLWHIPAIAVAALTLHAAGLDAYDVDASAFWALLALRALVFAVVMGIIFRLLSPLEHRRLPWWDGPAPATGTRSTLAGALMCVAGVALLLMAKNGLGGIEGITALGGFLAAAAGARVAASDRSRSCSVGTRGSDKGENHAETHGQRPRRCCGILLGRVRRRGADLLAVDSHRHGHVGETHQCPAGRFGQALDNARSQGKEPPRGAGRHSGADRQRRLLLDLDRSHRPGP